MADEADLANDRAEQYIADAIRQARANADMAPSNGICKPCQVAIEAERLRANPAARLCQDCAIEAEAARKRAQRIGG